MALETGVERVAGYMTDNYQMLKGAGVADRRNLQLMLPIPPKIMCMYLFGLRFFIEIILQTQGGEDESCADNQFVSVGDRKCVCVGQPIHGYHWSLNTSYTRIEQEMEIAGRMR